MKCWPVPIANASASAVTRSDRGDDLPGALAQLARPVEPVAPEDEHRSSTRNGSQSVSAFQSRFQRIGLGSRTTERSTSAM